MGSRSGEARHVGYFGVVAGDDMPRLEFALLRRDRRAQIGFAMAARLEAAAGRQRVQRRRIAGDRRQRRQRRVHVGEGFEQPLGIGVERLVEDGVHVAIFGDFAAVHDQHIVAQFGDDAEIVGDQHAPTAQAAPADAGAGQGFAPVSSRRGRLSARRRSGCPGCRRVPSQSWRAGASRR